MALKITLKLIICVFLFSCSSSSNFFDRIDIIKKMNSFSKVKTIKVFSRKELENIKYPLLEIKTNGILKQALMLPLSQRNNYFNYSSGSGQIITINGFNITKTNGINVDLISSELNKNSPLIQVTETKNWPISGFRKHLYLDHLNQIISYRYNCNFITFKSEKVIIVEVEHELTKIVEKCDSNEHSFENIYWVDKMGIVWKADQWLNKNVKATISFINTHYIS